MSSFGGESPINVTQEFTGADAVSGSPFYGEVRVLYTVPTGRYAKCYINHLRFTYQNNSYSITLNIGGLSYANNVRYKDNYGQDLNRMEEKFEMVILSAGDKIETVNFWNIPASAPFDFSITCIEFNKP